MQRQDPLPQWWPGHPPIYDIDRSYLVNAEEGPFFSGKFPERQLPPPSQWTDFLGFKVASRLGVPAGPLLNAKWTTFAAKMGFDIVTYKTIRSAVHPAHPVPNMVYVDVNRPLLPSEEGAVVQSTKVPPADLEHLAATNSFGIPSRDPDYIRKDIAKAQAALQDGQVMIVSIVGTPRPNEDFVEDFALATRLALEGGAKIIEADYSCPNVLSCEGSIHTNPDSVFTISKRIRKELGDDVPLVIKVGVIQDKEVLRAVMRAAHRSGVQAICGINTMSMRVVKEDGTPALGENRLRAGLCGSPIRHTALEFARNAANIIEQDKLPLTLMATGGVTAPEHFDLFFDAGVDVAMSAVGMMWDPFLAMRYHQGAMQ